MIRSHVLNGICNLVTSSNMVKLMSSPTFDSTITYKKRVKNTSLVDLLLNKGVVDNHSLHKVSHSFPKVILSERTSITTRVAIVDNIELAIQVDGHYNNRGLFCNPNIITNNKERSFQKPAVANNNSLQTLKLL